MRRFQMMLDADLDERLDHEAARRGTSKAELIRSIVAKNLAPLPPLDEDPIVELIGISDAEPVDDIDRYLYG